MRSPKNCHESQPAAESALATAALTAPTTIDGTTMIQLRESRLQARASVAPGAVLAGIFAGFADKVQGNFADARDRDVGGPRALRQALAAHVHPYGEQAGG